MLDRRNGISNKMILINCERDTDIILKAFNDLNRNIDRYIRN